MPVIPNLFDEINANSKPNVNSLTSVIPDLFPVSESAKSSTPESAKSGFIQEGFIKPAKSFYGGTLKAAAGTADLINVYANRVKKMVGLPENDQSIYNYLSDNWNYYGDKLKEEGVSNKLIKEIYQGFGQAVWDIPVKYLGPGKILGKGVMPVVGALEGGKEGGVKGAVVGAVEGAIMQGTISGLQRLPATLKYPVAAGIGALSTPGGVEEKVAGATVFAGLSAGRSPSMKEFKESMKYSSVNMALEKLSAKTEGVYQNYFNRFQALENISKKAIKAGKQLKPGEDPGLLARSYLGNPMKTKAILEDKTFRTTPEGKIEITGEGLKPILNDYDKLNIEKNIKVRSKDLNDYLIAQRTIKDLQRPKSEFTQENIVTPEQVTKAQDTIKGLGAKYGDKIGYLEQTSQRLYEYQKRVLSTLVDSGNMSQEQFDTILAKNPNYVPFDRIIEGIDSTPGTPVSKNIFTGARSPIKKIKGSELEIHDTIESMIKNTYRITDIADRNKVARSVANLMEILPQEISPVKIKMQPITVTPGEINKLTGEPLKITEEPGTIFRPSQFKPKGNVIEYFDNGQRKYMEVTPNLYQAMTGINEGSSSLMIKILATPAKLLRMGATLTPEFITRNPIRDQFTASIQTRLGFKPFLDSGEAIADIVGKTSIYYDWLRSGGAYSGFVELSRPRLIRKVNELKANPTLLKKMNILLNPAELSQLTEQATRVGIYKAGIKSGLSPLEAGFQSREGTIDFARRGAKTKDINAVIAFFNAGLQGTDKSIRTAIADPVGFAAKGAALITIPTLMFYFRNRLDPDYKEVSQWQRDLFWVTKVGDTYVRIPKPFLYGQLFGTMPERFLDYLETADPEAFNQLGKSIYDSISPVAGDPASGLLATAVKPLIENATNWNFFTSRNIVPESRAKLLPPEQYTKSTSELAKIIGQNLNYSPAKIENLVQGWAGGSGRYALQGADLVIQRIKMLRGQPIEPSRSTELSDIPLIKGFVSRDIYASPESLQKFYNEKAKIESIYNTFSDYVKKEEGEKAVALYDRFPEIENYPILQDMSEALKDFDLAIEMTNKSAIFTNKQKQALVRDFEMQRLEVVKRVNELMKNSGKQTNEIIPNLFEGILPAN